MIKKVKMNVTPHCINKVLCAFNKKISNFIIFIFCVLIINVETLAPASQSLQSPSAPLTTTSESILKNVVLKETKNYGGFATQPRSLRLPNTTFPLHYHLHISSNIHLNDLNYSANITIDIAIRHSTNEIVLHSKHLEGFLITVHNLDTGELVEDLMYSLNSVAQLLIIHPIQNYLAFEAGQKYRIQILFKAKLYEKTTGFYWLTYNYQNATTNRTVYLAATQFEPTHARLAFPCYDEPAYKANFTIRITHGSNYMAISNMQVQHVQRHTSSDEGSQADEQNGMTTTQETTAAATTATTTFHTTPVMSTYLVAFVISDFECISKTYHGVTQRLFSPPGSKIKGYGFLHNAVRAVAALGDYLGINYPLKKLDHIALQKNYGSAMENWGLITYKDETLLHDDDTDNDSDNHTCADGEAHNGVDTYKKLKDIITQNHEIAHQWFGNLVSPEYWSYAWLNEGFATYFSFVITDMIYPEMRALDFFLTDVAERAYSIGFITVRPMTHYVEKESEILSVFDIITYKRAACIIKMFHHALNQQTFVRGISYYLTKFQYGFANEMQLFESIQTAVSEDTSLSAHSWANRISDIMLSWTHSEWIPIITITRNYDDHTVTLKQRSKHQHSGEHWWIPINFATKSSPDFNDTSVDYFIPPLEDVTISINDLGIRLDPDDWLIANIQQTSFYHIIYDNENLMRIASALQQDHTAIHTLNRGLIFQDLTPLIESNEIESIDIIFELFKYLRFETELIPWNLVADTMEYFHKNLFGTPSFILYKDFIRGLVTPTFRRLFKSTHPQACRSNLRNSDILAKQKILDIACAVDLPECINYTRQLAHDYIFRSIKLQTEGDYYSMLDSILCHGIKHLNDEEFNGIMNILLMADPKTRVSEYYDDIIYALRCTHSKEHLKHFLNLLLGANSTHNIMNDGDSMMYIGYIYKSNLIATSVIWRFFEENYKTLSRSPKFAECFNRMADYVPEELRPKFFNLHSLIATELSAIGIDPDKVLIAVDSQRIGKKVKMSESFRQKFAKQIYDWLMRELSPARDIAAFFARSSAHRPYSHVFRSATNALRKLIKFKL